MMARVGFYPQSGFFLYQDLPEPKKGADGVYLSNLLSKQAQIDPENYNLAVLSAQSGTPVNFGEAPEKEVLFCGLQIEEIKEFQNFILKEKVFPQSVEISTLPMLGALKDYLAYSEITDPVLFLELGMKSSHAFILSNGKVVEYRKLSQGMHRIMSMVQSELGLKDIKAAARLFNSDTFDFQEMGPRLTSHLLKEINAFTSFYEVEKGETVRHIHCASVSGKLPWLIKSLAKLMMVDPVEISYENWFQDRGIDFETPEMAANLPFNFLGIVGLMLNSSPQTEENGTQEETA
ncbi:MAG: hypothetical protein JJT75_09410 [Opitutales bacterium]|nr:hypothetical protein [Opitutales bacterium]MCH8539907.1 hypothetical protein [Opitutales bacterium]